MARHIQRVESIVLRRAEAYGGKAKNLAALVRGGFLVPAAFALPGATGEAFLAEALPEDDLPTSLLAGGPLEPRRLEAIAARVRSAPLPVSLRDELSDAFTSLRQRGATAVAVRSSSTQEDQEASSAAGLHATVLNVTTDEGLFAAVKECWASLFRPQVFAYMQARGIAPETSVGILVQAMVEPTVAGVLFTVNPMTGDASEMVVNAAYGLGSAVVDGHVSPDALRFDKAHRSVRDRILGGKATRVVPAPEGGVMTEEVPAELREAFCIDSALEAELVSLGLRVEAQLGGPRDVEWALAGGRLYVLQARPITTPLLPATRRWKRRPLVDRSRIVWSNLNVGEALPGVATPLTWSVLSGFSELGFRRAFGALGCTVPRDAELVGDFRGRIYLNMSEFMGILSQVPGLRPKMLLSLGGGGEAERLESETERRSSAAFLARLPLTLRRFARENYQVTERLAAFEELYQQESKRLSEIDLRLLSPAAVSRTLHDVERLLDESGAIMLTVYANLLASMVLLSGLLRLLMGPEAERMQRHLMSGLSDVDSAAPGIAIWHIAEMARAEEGARAVLLAREARALRLEDLPPGPTRRALGKFMQAYGHRGAREPELSEPRWKEDPTVIFASLQIHLRSDPGRERPIDVERRQRAVRQAALTELETVARGPSFAGLRHLLSLVQRFTRLRERLRSHVTEVLGLIRAVALDVGRRLEAREPGVGPDAAFFLTIDEIHAWARGGIEHASARVGMRRLQHEQYLRMPDPPDTFVGFPPPVALPSPSADRLVGLGASSGRVEGLARVLASAADAGSVESGDILVGATADVGLGPLFLVAGGVVTELGGPLSHAAIVLREYGVPAVVNVKHATRLIRTGDRILVDGDRGEVIVIERAPEEA